MKNGHDKIFNVKKSFAIGNQVALMEGDQLEYISADRDENTDEVNLYFEVINSFWGKGLEINLTPDKVVEYLVYNRIVR